MQRVHEPDEVPLRQILRREPAGREACGAAEHPARHGVVHILTKALQRTPKGTGLAPQRALQLRQIGESGAAALAHMPCDRLLAAQAKHERFTLVTRDKQLLDYPIKTLEA